MTRYIVQRAKKNFRGETYFSSSSRGAESMYDSLSVAKRQAKFVGDQVFELDLSMLGKLDTQGHQLDISWLLVFTREAK